MQSIQFDRRWELYLADKSGDALDLSHLKSVFAVSKKDSQTPNEGRFVITNISRENAARLQKSFTKIIVNAGYKDNYGVIFNGNIKSYAFGRDGTDLFLDIKAGDGDKEYNYSVINRTLAAGASPDSIAKEVSTAMGVPIGYQSQLEQNTLPRGKVLYGRPQEFMRELADNQQCTWSIQDSEILLLKRTEVKKGEAVLLTPTTGLIGIPEKAEDGVKGTCLLNPKLKIGACIKLQSPTASALDGEYRLIGITHKGDTRGNDWYTNFTALALNPTGGKDKVSKK